jgi:predicted nucleic-acid-binding protein
LKIIADTNLIVRFLLRDDEAQFKIVTALFGKAEQIVIPTHVICELAWVLLNGYKLQSRDVLESITQIVQSHKAVVREDEIDAGLHMMAQGGDFADGVNAYSGGVMARGAVFASFDKQVVRLLTGQGTAAMVPA